MQANQYEQYCPQICPEDCKNKEQLLDDKCWNKNNCQKGKKKPPLIKKKIRLYVHSPHYSLDIPPIINCFYLPTYLFSDPNNLKSPDEEDCDQQCIGGCTRSNDRNYCFACKNVMYEFSQNNNNQTKFCIDKCPDKFLLVSYIFFRFKKNISTINAKHLFQ